MLSSLLALSLLGVSATSTNGAPASISITFTATLVSSSQVTMNSEQLEIPEAYAVNIEAIETGRTDSRMIKERYLVIDDMRIGFSHMAFTFHNNEININNPRNIFVMKIDDGERMPKRKELLAMLYDLKGIREPNYLASYSRLIKKVKKKRS